MDEGLWQAVGARAKAAGSTKTAVVAAALEQALSEAEGALSREQAGPAPVVPVGAVRPAASARASSLEYLQAIVDRTRERMPPAPKQVNRDAMARQARLNKGKG